MPGVKWHKWTPFFVEETDSLIDIWTEKVRTYLVGVEKISSRNLKQALEGDKLTRATWTRIIRKFLEQHHAPKDVTRDGAVWKLEGQSLVRRTAESYGFEKIA